MFAGCRVPGAAALFIPFERNPALRPASDLAQRTLELASFGSELVLNADWSLGNHRPVNQSLGLEGAKTLREHAVGDVGDRAFNGGVAAPALKQGLENRPSPPATDELDGPVKPGTNYRCGTGRLRHGKKLWETALDTSYLLKYISILIVSPVQLGRLTRA